MTTSTQQILSTNGLIADALPSYEPRPQQVEMAQAVEDALRDEKHLLVEAGTGVGKSFAYLVPAFAALAEDRECRIVIATHTISLQEQLLLKDVPFLQSVLPGDIRPVLVKGRSNYLSLRRLRAAQQRVGVLLSDREHAQELAQIGKWSRQSQEGSKSDLSFQPSPAVWELVASDSGNCLGRQCPEYSKCFYFKARKQMHGANLLIVNHALYFSDLAVRKAGGSLLPPHQAVIFDEAHVLEDVASDHLGLQINRGSLDYLLNKLYNRRNRKGLLTALGDQEAINQVERARSMSEQLFQNVMNWTQKQPRRAFSRSTAISERVLEPNIVPNTVSEELKKLATRVAEISDNLEDEIKIEYLALADRCLVIAENLNQWLTQQLEGQVYWVDVTGTDLRRRIALVSAPIDVGPALQEQLYDKVPSVIMTSATLSAGGNQGFRYVQNRLGLEDANTAQLGSPFNYKDHVKLHLYQKMPDPSKQPSEYDEACLHKIVDSVRRSEGRAFVLFTSYTALRKATEKLEEQLTSEGMTLISQAEGLPRSQMLEKFRESEKAVLFGVDSFWQGVDVPGDDLVNVIITKLPFVAPDRPILAARQDAIEEAGGNAFFDYQVPQAVIKLKQGFGRLIRRGTDRGEVSILDPRVLTKGYGKAFLDALPECQRSVDGQSVPEE